MESPINFDYYDDDSSGVASSIDASPITTKLDSNGMVVSRMFNQDPDLIGIAEDRKWLLEVPPSEGYIKFETIPVMTITMIGYLDGDISIFDRDALWKINHLLPVTRLNLKRPSRLVKKFTVSYPGNPWLILTTNLNGEIRGLIKTYKKGSWPNSIMIDMSVPNKIINFKLSPDNIHMCGCKSIEMGENAAKGLLRHILFINRCLGLIGANSADAKRIAYEVLDDCTVWGTFSNADPDDGFKYLCFDPSRVKPNIQDTEDQNTIRTFISAQIGDLIRYDQAKLKVDWVLEQTPLFERNFAIEDWFVCLVKYRFSLGFRVNLAALVTLIYEYFEYFYTDFHPMIQDYVKIEILDPHVGVTCKATAKHTFSVYENGNVTYNSPNKENSYGIYNLFISTIDEIRSEIEIM